MEAMRPAQLILSGILVLSGSILHARPVDPSLYGDLRWRLVGPFRGGWGTCAIQKDAYARARSDLDALLGKGQGAK
jgi:hypothetical protein